MVPSWPCDSSNMHIINAVCHGKGTQLYHTTLYHCYPKDKQKGVQGWGLEHALGPLPTHLPVGGHVLIWEVSALFFLKAEQLEIYCNST